MERLWLARTVLSLVIHAHGQGMHDQAHQNSPSDSKQSHRNSPSDNTWTWCCRLTVHWLQIFVIAWSIQPGLLGILFCRSKVIKLILIGPKLQHYPMWLSQLLPLVCSYGTHRQVSLEALQLCMGTARRTSPGLLLYPLWDYTTYLLPFTGWVDLRCNSNSYFCRG